MCGLRLLCWLHQRLRCYWRRQCTAISPVAETELYFKWLEVTGAVTKGAEWADRAGSTQFSDLIDPARGHSQAAQASAAAKIRTTAANRKLVKFHKDICSQWASSHYQAKQALLATQQRWTFSSLQNETLFSKRPFSTYNFCSMYFCKWCVEKTWLTILQIIIRHKVQSCLQLWTWTIDTRFSLRWYEKWWIRKVFNGTWLI